jgi:hypothetical protein
VTELISYGEEAASKTLELTAGFLIGQVAAVHLHQVACSGQFLADSRKIGAEGTVSYPAAWILRISCPGNGSWRGEEFSTLTNVICEKLRILQPIREGHKINLKLVSPFAISAFALLDYTAHEAAWSLFEHTLKYPSIPRIPRRL